MRPIHLHGKNADTQIMTRFFALAFLFLTLNMVCAKSRKPLYKLPEQASVIIDENTSETKTFLVGTDKGLFKISADNTSVPLWAEGNVEQILRTEIQGQDGTLEPKKEFYSVKTCRLLNLDTKGCLSLR